MCALLRLVLDAAVLVEGGGKRVLEVRVDAGRLAARGELREGPGAGQERHEKRQQQGKLRHSGAPRQATEMTADAPRRGMSRAAAPNYHCKYLCRRRSGPT